MLSGACWINPVMHYMVGLITSLLSYVLCHVKYLNIFLLLDSLVRCERVHLCTSCRILPSGESLACRMRPRSSSTVSLFTQQAVRASHNVVLVVNEWQHWLSACRPGDLKNRETVTQICSFKPPSSEVNLATCSDKVQTMLTLFREGMFSWLRHCVMEFLSVYNLWQYKTCLKIAYFSTVWYIYVLTVRRVLLDVRSDSRQVVNIRKMWQLVLTLSFPSSAKQQCTIWDNASQSRWGRYRISEA